MQRTLWSPEPRGNIAATSRWTLVFSALLLGSTPGVGGAQSLLERPPNVSGNWVGAPGTLYFNFMHRFSTSDKPIRKVSNSPTLLLAAGLPRRLLVGFNYASNSDLSPRYPNEWEFFARGALLSQELNAPLDLAGQVGYNLAAEGVDGEVSIARKQGPLRLIAATRVLSDADTSGKTRFAMAGGATFQLGPHFALAGDAATIANKRAGERVAWSAGVHMAIPLTPHTLSIHASNVLVNTLQGLSRGTNEIRWGFEFVIPLTLRRYFGERATPTTVAALPDTTPARIDSAPAPVIPARPVSPDSIKADSAAARMTSADSARAVADSLARRGDSARVAPRPPARVAPRPPAAPPATTRPAARTVRTVIKNTSYLTPTIEVTVGSTVEWRNADNMLHTVTALDKSFDSGLMRPAATFRYTFTRPGRYSFYCMPHTFMKGVVIVK